MPECVDTRDTAPALALEAPFPTVKCRLVKQGATDAALSLSALRANRGSIPRTGCSREPLRSTIRPSSPEANAPVKEQPVVEGAWRGGKP